MIARNAEEIAILREGGKILASVLSKVAIQVAPGRAARDLDYLAERLINEFGGRPSFKNYKTSAKQKPYPASLCVSINDEVVHGIPGDKVLLERSIVGLDLAIQYKGFYTDMAASVPGGFVDQTSRKLLDVCKESLRIAIESIQSDGRVGDVGAAVQKYVEENGFSVVRDLVGHGVGHSVHEDPESPNVGKAGMRYEFHEGQVLALEPMITAGGAGIILDDDGWTWKTRDRSLSAHFEHTVLVTKNGCEVLTGG